MLDGSGEPVAFEVVESSLIRFASVKGERYTVARGKYAGKRVTFRITAVAEDGTESAGSTVVLIP